MFNILTDRVLFLQLVNHVYFSPDGQWVASASFDKSVKLWNGITGDYVATFRGHVGPVYQIRSTLFLMLVSFFSSSHLLTIASCFVGTAGLLIAGLY